GARRDQALGRRQQHRHQYHGGQPRPHRLHHGITAPTEASTEMSSSSAQPPVMPRIRPKAPPSPSMSLHSPGAPTTE
ncbi:HTH cro/C1-type domain-containing protein, partial [Dysosmobacter welbionis]